MTPQEIVASWTTGHCYYFGAEDGTRTRDPDLGKVVLYQLSHFRMRLE